MDDKRWRDPGFLAAAQEWIDERLSELGIARTGEPSQPHVYPWSTVLRVPADGGDVWFKVNDDSLRHEALIAQRIAARRPDAGPPLLASDAATGWMLLDDAGDSLRVLVERERSLDRWLDVLPLYASMQLDLAADVEDLLKAGVPDMRLAVLPDAYLRLLDEVGAEQRFRDAAPMVSELCAELASYGLPELIQHDDLHDGQVFFHNGQYRVLDWGDACVSHPFFTLSVTLEGVLSWGLDDVADSVDTTPFREAYLSGFGGGHLAAAVKPALRLGWVCRAINGHIPGEDKATLTRLRMFLDGHP